MQSLFRFHTPRSGLSHPRKIWKFSSLENAADNCKVKRCRMLNSATIITHLYFQMLQQG